MIRSLSDPELSLVALVAPAGYGKSSLVDSLRRAGRRSVVVDCAGVSGERELAVRVVEAFAEGSSERADSLALARLSSTDGAADREVWAEFALDAWGFDDAPLIAVFENAEALVESGGDQGLLYRLLSVARAGRTVIFCSRVPLPFRLTRFAPPHRVLTIRAEELAFSRDEIVQLFDETDLSQAALDDVVALTRGWPIAVLLVRRLVPPGDPRAVVARLAETGSDLSEYLVEQVFYGLPVRSYQALQLCAAVPDVTEEDLALVMGSGPADLTAREALLDLPFVTRSADRVVRLHPIVAQLLRERYPDELRRVSHAAAQAWEARSNVVRAAQLYVSAGDKEAAARVLDTIPPFVFSNSLPDCALVASHLDPDTICSYPNLWLSTIPSRLYGMSLDAYVREAKQIWYGLPKNVATDVRVAVLIQYTSALYQAGRIEECEGLLGDAISRTAAPSQRSALMFHLATRLGMQGRFAEAQDLCVRAADIADAQFVRGRALDYVDAHHAFMLGEYEHGFTLIDLSGRMARRSGVSLAAALTLTNAAIFAWVAGDDGRFKDYIDGLERVLVPGIERGFRFFLACARAEDIDDDRECNSLIAVACGHLFRAGSVQDAAGAAAAALRAAEIADVARDPYVQVLAHVAVAELVPARRRAELDVARGHAARIESEPLREAVASLAQSSTEAGILRPFVDRLRRKSPAETQALRVGVFDGAIWRLGVLVDLTERELALLVALAVHDQPLSKERLTDMLWPDLDPEAAGNNLKVQVHRLRRKLKMPEAIALHRNAYELGASVEVDYRELLSRLRTIRRRGLNADEDREWFKEQREILRGGRPARMCAWEWFEPKEREISELHREVCLALANLAIAAHDGNLALDAASDLIAIDAYDEAGREIAIRAHVLAGDRGSALREFRQYRDLLRSELNAEPSAALLRVLSSLEGHEVAS